eukprot:CAMPEP_0113287058 /NCGR_PEP_ID=MMETSP0008_2-20120614/31487_1 /TAXON_ID=97485 /ORGANISM="Prymnesium parvum" /LENGTH=91 /DNA_ID=CAMNT_0000138227 /DNA_START=583 /DNA_END=856 /DNA_ORIENTATION=+ /assembly_acc=CAM_ASM_000153
MAPDCATRSPRARRRAISRRSSPRSDVRARSGTAQCEFLVPAALATATVPAPNGAHPDPDVHVAPAQRGQVADERRRVVPLRAPAQDNLSV